MLEDVDQPAGLPGRSRGGPMARVVAVPNWLLSIAAACVVVSTAGVVWQTVTEIRVGFMQGAKLAPTTSFRLKASSSAAAAHVTLTNMSEVALSACFRGFVRSKKTGTRVDSAVVCTGDVKPRTTVTIDAPYDAGAVEELCGEVGSLGVRRLNWELCTFDLEDETKV